MALLPVGITHEFNGDVSVTANDKLDSAQLDTQLANLANKTNAIIAVLNRVRDVSSVVQGYYTDAKLDFGAVGDGVTDDLAAIQAAVDSMSGGGTVFIPPGTYLLSDTLKLSGTNGTVSGVKLTGAGKTDTTLKLANGSLKNIIAITANSEFEVCNLDVYGSRNRGTSEPIPCYIWQPGLRYTKVGSRYSTRPGGAYNPTPLVDDVVWELTTAMSSKVSSDMDGVVNTLDGTDLTYFTLISGPGVVNKYQYDLTFEEGHGIYVSGTRGTSKVDVVYIHDNNIRETVYSGVCAGAGTSIASIISEGCSNVIAERNKITSPGATAIGGTRRSNALIQANTIFGSDSGGINVDEDGENNVIAFNIIDGGEPISFRTIYKITAVTPSAAGAGYLVGDRLYVGGDTASTDPAICRVDTIDGGGGILTLSVLSQGHFTSSPTGAFTGGTGAAAVLDPTVGTINDNTYDTRYGISVYASDGNFILCNIISHCNDGIKVVGIGTDIGSSVTNNTVFECGQGIYSYSAETCTIADNPIRDCDIGGINVMLGNNMSICGNQIANISMIDAYAIRVRNSLSCSISNNVMENVSKYGIYAQGLRKSTLTANVVRNAARISEVPAILFTEYGGVGSTENIVSSSRVFDTGSTSSRRLITYGVYCDALSISNTFIGNDLTDTLTGGFYEDATGNVVMARDAGPSFTFNCRLNTGSVVPITNGVYGLGTAALSWDNIYVDKIYLGDNSTTLIKSGTGSPSGVVSADVGSTFYREDGDGYRREYVKARNSDATGWIPSATKINVQLCGAVGDGSTDDTAAIKSAFDIAAGLVDSLTNIAGGSRAGTIDIYFPRGRYMYAGNANLITNPSGGSLSYGLRIVGDGQSTSQIDWAPSGTVTSEQALLDFDDVSYAHINIKDVGFRVSNSHTQAVCIRTAATSNGTQDSQIEGCSFYNFANVIVTDGTDLSSEWVLLRNRILGANNQAAILIRGTDQTLNWNLYGNTWLCTKGSFIQAPKGGGIRVHGLNAFNTSSSVVSGTITGRQVYVNAAAASGAKANLRSCGDNFSYVSGMNLRFVDNQLFTLNASGTIGTGADVVQPTAANLAADLRDKSLATIWPTVQLSANFNANDATVSLVLIGGPVSATIKRGDRIRVGTTDTATYTCIEDATVDNVGVAVKILPTAQSTTASGADVHCRAPAVFELLDAWTLGGVHARGVTSFSCIGWRPEHRNADSRSLYCEWDNGTVTFIDCDESVQSSTGRPLWTHYFSVGNASGPRITFSNCIFHGCPVYYYYSGAYDKHQSARYTNCNFRVGVDPFTNFCFRPQNTVNSADHTNLGSIPVIYCEGVKGDSTLVADYYANDAVLNSHKAYHSAKSSTVRFRDTTGLSPGASTALQVYLPMNAVIRNVKIYMRPGATANVTAGCTYIVQTSDGTVHGTAAPATLNLGFDVDVSPTNGAFVCDTGAKRLLQLVTNASISAQVQDFLCEVEYV